MSRYIKAEDQAAVISFAHGDSVHNACDYEQRYGKSGKHYTAPLLELNKPIYAICASGAVVVNEH